VVGLTVLNDVELLGTLYVNETARIILPTSADGLPVGAIWNNGGVVTVVTG